MSVLLVPVAWLLLSLASSGVRAYSCEGVGYYPHPSDCSQFFRCTDIYSNGQFQQYEFTCAEGTVFDASISVCNWPAVVPGCGGAAPSPAPAPAVTTTSATPPVTTPAPAPDTEVTEETEVTTEAATTAEAETVTYQPAAGSAYQCSGPGIYNDEDNCNKFWLCKEEPADSGVLQSLLYRCPPGYLFNSSSLRCKKEEDVSCVETPETRNVEIIQLTEAGLEAFFSKWSQ